MVDEPLHVVIYVTRGFSLLSLSCVPEALCLANRALGRPAYRWSIVSDMSGTVEAACGIAIAVEGAFAEGGGPFSTTAGPRAAMTPILADQEIGADASLRLAGWLRRAHRDGSLIAAAGYGVHFLAKSGMLANKKCSLHWNFIPSFSEEFRSVVPASTIYTVDGNLWTCSGGVAVFDMLLRFVERNHGSHIVGNICEQLVMERIRTEKDRQRIPRTGGKAILGETVKRIIDQMEDRLSEPLTTSELAAAVGLSRRQVERRFSQELGTSPLQFYRELRMERARLLITRSALPMVDVAVACGFVSASHFTRSYRDYFGATPSEERRRALTPLGKSGFQLNLGTSFSNPRGSSPLNATS